LVFNNFLMVGMWTSSFVGYFLDFLQDLFNAIN
jgi:hypothetical protein